MSFFLKTPIFRIFYANDLNQPESLASEISSPFSQLNVSTFSSNAEKLRSLAYRSENRSKIERPIDQKWKYLRQLGSDDVYPEKPKWMKEHKFDKICQKIDYYDRLAHLRFFRTFGHSSSVILKF